MESTKLVSTNCDGRLGFFSSTRKNFSFLLQCGFSEVQAGDLLVRFESKEVFLLVCQGYYSYTLGVEFGLLRQPYDEKVTLFSVLSVFVPEQARLAIFQSHNAEAIGRGLRQLADLVQEHCSQLLDGDRLAFSQVQKHIKNQTRHWILDNQFHVVRSNAQSAWEKKRYRDALQLYLEMEEALTDSEKRRLLYLKRRFARQMTSSNIPLK